MKKRSSLFISLLFSVALLLGFTTASEAITIDGSIQSGQVIWQVRTTPGMDFVATSFMQQDIGPDFICEPGLINVTPTGVDTASTSGTLSDENGDGRLDLLTIRTTGAYPHYYNSVTTKVYNSGPDTIMPNPVLTWMGKVVSFQDYIPVVLCNAEGTPVAEFCWNDNTGKTFLRGRTFQEGLEFSILNIEPPDQPCNLNGLTPGYWKNWRNHYTEAQFTSLLPGTIAGDITAANSIFSKYSAAPGKELSIFKAQLLAAQLTLNLIGLPELPNPDGASLNVNGQIQWQGETITIGSAIKRALAILANPASFNREQILDCTLLLDTINNM